MVFRLILASVTPGDTARTKMSAAPGNRVKITGSPTARAPVLTFDYKVVIFSHAPDYPLCSALFHSCCHRLDRPAILDRRPSCDGKAWLWENGKTYDLQRCLRDAPGWALLGARSIDNRGQIVCTGTFHGKPAECLLTP